MHEWAADERSCLNVCAGECAEKLVKNGEVCRRYASDSGRDQIHRLPSPMPAIAR